MSSGDRGITPTPHASRNQAPVAPDGDRIVPTLIDACPEDLECQICRDVADAPVVTDVCGHLFCSDCINRSLAEKAVCPMDRRPLAPSDLRKDVRSQRRIHSLACKCHNHTTGCAWTGTIGDISHHLLSCEFNPVSCPFAQHGCQTTSIPRHALAEHIQTSMSVHLLLVSENLSKLWDDHRALQQELDLSVQRSRDDVVTALAHHQSGGAFSSTTGVNGGFQSSSRKPSVGTPVPNVFRFIWVIPSFSTKRSDPVYSREFFAKGYRWYLGVDFDEMDDHAGVYLFAEDHAMRANFKLILFHSDPSKDIVHVVSDWTVQYKGKGWGPLKFVDRRAIQNHGYIDKGCIRIGVEMDGEPYE